MGTSEGSPPSSSSPLPPLYDRWMQALLAAPLAPETEATCDRCAMCKEHEDRGTGIEYFKPDRKCCTFMPNLPNFLVGSILADTEAGTGPGKASVERRIAAGLAVTPLGLGDPAVRRLLYEAGGDEGFGKSRALLCPHFAEDTGLCGIWRHRNSVCATYFCKHVRGAVGFRLWTALRGLLGTVETTLAEWCVLELGFEPEALKHISEQESPLDAKALDGVPDAAVQRRLWGSWHGREKEFYLEAAKLVEPLSWDQVVQIGGPSLRMCAVLAKDAHSKATSESLPPKLVPGALMTMPLPGGMTRVTTYRAYDPLSLPNEMIEVLSHFDGRPTEEVLASLEREHGVAVERDLLLQLVDFEILVPPPDRREGD